MAKRVLETKELCSACGVDVRPEALFCYNCGGPVAEAKAENGDGPGDELAVPKIDSGAEAEPDSDSGIPIPNPFLTETAETERNGNARIRAVTTKKKDSAKLRSAANLRNRARNLEPQRIEIIWEEHDNAPNIWFIVVSVAFSILFVLVVLASMYLK